MTFYRELLVAGSYSKFYAISINLCLLGCNEENTVSAFEHIVRFW